MLMNFISNEKGTPKFDRILLQTCYQYHLYAIE